TLFEFYDERVGAEVVSARHFDTWWKHVRREQPELLTLPRELVLPDEDAVSGEAFPLVWPQGELELALSYQFEPGTAADGVTVHVPLEVLPRVTEHGFDWPVPGLREELVVATIRSLPKPVRVQLVPAADVARQILAWLEASAAAGDGTVLGADAALSFRESFARAARELRGVVVSPEDFDPERLPAHLRVTFRVEEAGRRAAVVDEGPDLVVLQRRHAARAQDAVRAAVRSAVQASTTAPDAASPAPVGDEPSPPGPERNDRAPGRSSSGAPRCGRPGGGRSGCGRSGCGGRRGPGRGARARRSHGLAHRPARGRTCDPGRGDRSHGAARPGLPRARRRHGRQGRARTGRGASARRPARGPERPSARPAAPARRGRRPAHAAHHDPVEPEPGTHARGKP